MERKALWSVLEAHPMADWLKPMEPALPYLDPEARLIWCGIGGSLAPAQALIQALGTPQQRRQWVALDAPDPEAPALLPTDHMVFASKSGRTLELWSWISRLRALPGWGHWEHAPLVLTQDDQNPLAAWAKAEGFTLLPLPPGMGGRYSAFTSIGTVPLAWLGGDPKRYIDRARRVAWETESGVGPWGARVWRAVDLLLVAYRRGVKTWAFMPYGNRLSGLGAWWVQLMAESLGKTAPGGNRLAWTPLRALGPQDQHAQLQRWIGGARDTGVFLLTSGGPPVDAEALPPSQCPIPGLERIGPSRLLEAQAQATQRALEEAGVPTARWHLDEGCTEMELGALLMAWQLATALVGLSMGVDPFDQPEVEIGKRWIEPLLEAFSYPPSAAPMPPGG